MKGIISVLRTFLVNLIRLYRKSVSRLIPMACRYYPSCSHYSEDAIIKYGPAKGLVLSALRVLRCNQFFKGGYDPLT